MTKINNNNQLEINSERHYNDITDPLRTVNDLFLDYLPFNDILDISRQTKNPTVKRIIDKKISINLFKHKFENSDKYSYELENYLFAYNGNNEDYKYKLTKKGKKKIDIKHRNNIINTIIGPKILRYYNMIKLLSERVFSYRGNKYIITNEFKNLRKITNKTLNFFHGSHSPRFRLVVCVEPYKNVNARKIPREHFLEAIGMPRNTVNAFFNIAMY